MREEGGKFINLAILSGCQGQENQTRCVYSPELRFRNGKRELEIISIWTKERGV